jgi:hypothetical protein
MADLITASEINNYHNAINDHFDTFKRQITVHKEPIKNIVQNTTTQLLGYQEDSNIIDYTYTPRNQSFDAIISYNTKTENFLIQNEVKLKFPNQLVEIKVKQAARDYINNDITEKIAFDNKIFNVVTPDIVKNYQGLIYYVYLLQEIT